MVDNLFKKYEREEIYRLEFVSKVSQRYEK